VKSPTEISLGGFVPLSTVDWPDQLAATVFTRGCPWDCPYCHNPHLIARAGTAYAGGDNASSVPTWSEVLGFLTQRVGLLDGVVFSGGEPCAQAALPGAVEQVRELGLAVGLHTAGSVPAVFEAVLPHVAWVGFDVKAPFADYARITRVEGSGEHALEALRALVASGVEFEARTTVHPDLLSSDDLLQLAQELEAEGVRRWALQGYRPEGARPGLLAPATLTADEIPAGLSERFELTVR
jgi:pyruvate formate lyase activating enzyme